MQLQCSVCKEGGFDNEDILVIDGQSFCRPHSAAWRRVRKINQAVDVDSLVMIFWDFWK